MIVLQEVKVLQRRSDWVSFETGRTLNLFRVRAKTLKVYLFHHPIFKRKSSNYPSVLHRRILAFFCYKSEWPPKELRPTKSALATTKRPRIGKTTATPPVVPDGQRKSTKHAFLDDTTGFGDGLSLRKFINPQVAKLYNDVRVSNFRVS